MSSSDTTAALDTAIPLLAWYAFNGAFNVENKRVLNELSYPWIISWVQLAAGIGIAVPAWLLGLRRPPVMTAAVLLRFLPIAVLHAAGHALQVAGIGAGSVYFGTIIKATEPLIGTLIAYAVDGKAAPWYVNLTFVPIVGGIAYAAAKPGAAADLSDLASFAAVAALSSTVFFALAKLLVKRLMTADMKRRHGLDAANTYSVLTCCSAALLLAPSLLLCGLYYFAYNECGFRVLDKLSPVSQAAVANAAKRLVILFFAVVFLGEEARESPRFAESSGASGRKLVGAGVAIAGVTSYSFARLRADAHARAKAKKAS
ncbi:hypothetical protein EMIHUDRAFT_453445 [Emiliania huxleyi CCMP1516]|uniref:Sugar phosphate transporter domain-containing protein n=2 Tax=Emiliania huxleyi TaxID=2903 RepID=A0A0D3I5P4_EMIH1|nr:hypothetical protein EMIHUDRAFT_453445 [Emiliania huxleyi CCMP1516]EOD06579.1 hypothetical protein EMIHUDRAFT_453445 [Emiliania huxleyi CCMP1516]|eukprot:XP_005759008.1 hypothetical protein EMIHUDRAFT_453445 [Emiliania huxleyi CCMP1516]